jgi:hypothetical protein
VSQQITIEVSEQAARHASAVAAQTQRRVEEVLAEWLESLIQDMPIETMSDTEVLALAGLQFSDEQQEILTDLLEQNREDNLDAEGRRRLDELMRIYEHGLLRKSQALRIAVERGMLEPLKFIHTSQ